MHIKDISVADVRVGKTWRVTPPVTRLLAKVVEEADLEEGAVFDAADQVIYSGLVAYPSGRVTAILLFKGVGEVEYGGVYWEFVNGSWRVVGEEPDPNYEVGGREFIANPLPSDPSFDSPDHDYRAAHRSGFLQHSHALDASD